MLGAIVGDIIGSRFERINWHGIEGAHKSKEFDLFTEDSVFTDDTICSCATAKAIMCGVEGLTEGADPFAWWTWKIGREYLDRGFGGKFTEWLKADGDGPPPPFGSWGNGSAMRVSPIGWLDYGIADLLQKAEDSAKITHDHPDAVKGAKAVVHAIWLARHSAGVDKNVIKVVMKLHYYPTIGNLTLDEIRPTLEFKTDCQSTVPVAIQAFLESHSFEDAIRNAISVGGDSDTIAAITGSIAHAFYGEVPSSILKEALSRLTPDLLQIVRDFCGMFCNGMFGEKNLKALQLPT